MSLIDDLKKPKNSLTEFNLITSRALNHLSEMTSTKCDFSGYKLISSISSGTEKKTRPINNDLFIYDVALFEQKFNDFIGILNQLKKGERNFQSDSYSLTDSVIYTIQQSIGIGFDLLGEPNSSRKHVGNRFEELIRLILTEIGITNKKLVLNIPYKSGKTIKNYQCEIDVVISKSKEIKSNNQTIHPEEIIFSLKTTTKDRMGKIFIDKLLIEKFTKSKVRVAGISLNDVQRKTYKDEKTKKVIEKISYTFVSNLFMVYTNFLTELEGYYFLDIPKPAKNEPLTNHIFKFSKFIFNDVWKMLA
ncbi:MAG: hypothetical protein D8M58_20405 [Calditrichaeota bacterium]|nr:MAG: hypothetical protein DWQ03_14390 [Calditrichota bacterium]MBL1207773.1 hypothetical protein [Calditrichota bacterium]NOG47606.1 hypothetical protein [Calditrichota bacterium]